MLRNIGAVFCERGVVFRLYVLSEYLILVELRLVVVGQALYGRVDKENHVVGAVIYGTAQHIDSRRVA